jgi:hypothetical protein
MARHKPKPEAIGGFYGNEAGKSTKVGCRNSGCAHKAARWQNWFFYMILGEFFDAAIGASTDALTA